MDEVLFEHDFIVACEMMRGKSFEAAERRARREMLVERGREQKSRVRRISVVDDHDRICLDVRY